MQMQLKEYVSMTFEDGVLDVFRRGTNIIRQPFNSDTGEKFKDQTEAEAWLMHHFPELFTPA